MSDLTVQQTSAPQSSCAKKGAKIALGAGILGRAATLGVLAKAAGKDVFISSIETVAGSKGKYAALMLAAIAVETAIGAGIGKLIDIAKAKKAEKQ